MQRYHYDRHDQLEAHLADFITADNYARRLKILRASHPTNTSADAGLQSQNDSNSTRSSKCRHSTPNARGLAHQKGKAWSTRKTAGSMKTAKTSAFSADFGLLCDESINAGGADSITVMPASSVVTMASPVKSKRPQIAMALTIDMARAAARAGSSR
ncbi:hypothetical protein ACVIHH_008289 [Bradyrhizobium sp. USDA 4518]